jgi:hypothetical protein
VIVASSGPRRGSLEVVGTVVGIVAFVVALVGLLAALGHVGYLAMLRGAARTRGAAGGATERYVAGRWTRAGGTAGVGLLGLLLTGGELPLDVLALLIGGGTGVVAQRALGETRAQFRSER